MPREAYSLAIVLVKPMTAALAADVGRLPAEPPSPVIDVMLMLRPGSRAFIRARKAARQQ